MKVSVVIPVYNGEKYVNDCIGSVLRQTYPDFELIVVNDGSTDRSLEMLREITDPRIRVVNRKHDFIRSLNTGFKKARGEYIARMDIDDIMMPDRLEKQVALLDERPETAVCSSWVECFGNAEGVLQARGEEIEFPLIEMLLSNIIFNPTAMIRRAFLLENRIRYQVYDYAEDYKMWFEIAKKGGRFWVIPEPLVKYRVSTDQVSYTKKDTQVATTLRIREEILETLLYKQPGPHNKEVRSIFRKVYGLNQRKLISETTVLRIVYRLLKELAYTGEK